VLLSRPLLAALTAFISACSGDRVNVGEDTLEPTVPSNSRCADDSRLAEDVTVTNQSELSALEGCEVIDGDLYVVPFAGADLRPLHALTSVEGTLAFAEAPGTVLGSEVARIQALNEAGWLTSLEGLESLESVGALQLHGLSTGLAPLANLRVVTEGWLEIVRCNDLRDLDGLQNVAGIDTLTLVCESLESMTGIQLPPSMTSLYIDAASLTDLGSFAVEGVESDMAIMNTRLQNLDALSGLRYVGGGLVLQNNPALDDMSGLDGLEVLGTLIIRDNASIEVMPPFTALSRIEGLMVYDNLRLRELPTFPALYADVGVLDGLDEDERARTLLAWRPDLIEVVGNPELEQLSIPRGWSSGSHVAVRNNAKIKVVDFARLESIDRLVISGNPLLDSVELGALATVASLKVQDNPLLAPSDFDPVQTFERDMSGNAASAP
jgi:hypothetical protein